MAERPFLVNLAIGVLGSASIPAVGVGGVEASAGAFAAAVAVAASHDFVVAPLIRRRRMNAQRAAEAAVVMISEAQK